MKHPVKSLALTLGKFNTMCCFFETKTRPPSGVTWIRSSKKPEIDLVVMEACGLSGQINDLAKNHGLKTIVCSANEDAWKHNRLKTNTLKTYNLSVKACSQETSNSDAKN